MYNDVKANDSYTAPRLRESSSKKIGTARLVNKLANDVKTTINDITDAHDYEKETFEKGVDDMKANGSHIVPRPQEANTKKTNNAGLVKKLVDRCRDKSRQTCRDERR